MVHMAVISVEMQAIAMDATNHVYFSNRSAAYIRLQKFNEALADADKAISLNSGYSKAYNCRGAALEGLGTCGWLLWSCAPGDHAQSSARVHANLCVYM